MKDEAPVAERITIGPHITIGDLRRITADLPADMPVLYQRIEDSCFKNHGWKPYKLLWERVRVSPQFAETMTDEERTQTEVIDGVLYFRDNSDYVVAFSAYKHPEKEVFVINAHY